MTFIVTFADLLLRALMFAIFLRAILSWFVPQGDHPVVRFLRDVTDPLLLPIRRVIPSVGMLDLTPFAAILLLQLLRSILIPTLAGGLG